MISRNEHRTSTAVVSLCITMALILLMAVIFTGCAPITSNVVRVPVPVPCEIPDVPVPALPIDAVASDADLFTIDRALWASLERLEAYVAQLRTMLDGCRTVPANP